MDLEQMKTENRGTYNFILLQNDFVNGFRDFGRAAIDEIIENEPALSGNDRWWDDIKKYNKENAPNYIFATDNKEVNTGSFDASGVAKWMLYMYSDGTLNTYLTGGCRAVSIEDCSPSEKPDTPYISHTSSLVMQMIQKTSLEELKQMGHTYLNYVRRNSSKNPLEDWKQAVNYYYAGAAQGDAECAAAVGYCCEMDPRGSNLPLALAWYQHAAKAGSAWAMEKVATFYEEGYGCTANRALADACRETLKYMR